MPIFELKCEDCQTEFETIVFRSDDEIDCPECESKKVTKLMSGFAKGKASFNPRDWNFPPSTGGGGGGCSSCAGGSCATCH